MRASYPIKQLTGETLALLTPATPIIVRMETLRRAALYATKDPAVARALLTTLLDRAKAKGAERWRHSTPAIWPRRSATGTVLTGNRGACRGHRRLCDGGEEPRARSRPGDRVRGCDDHRRRPSRRMGGARARRQIRRQHRPPPRPQYRQPRAIACVSSDPRAVEPSGLIQSSAAPVHAELCTDHFGSPPPPRPQRFSLEHIPALLHPRLLSRAAGAE